MNEHSGHYKLVCKECGIIIAQCRCMDLNKPTHYDVCEKCKGTTAKQTP
jgi:phage gp45-like